MLCAWGSAGAQTTSYQYSFQDSLRILLENTKNTEAGAVGVGFATLWASLGPDQQVTIRTQIKSMKRKGYRLRPHLVNYLGAIVDGLNFEKTDPSRLNNYLVVAAKVIANETIPKANDFFNQVRDFFQHHALNYEKSLHLNVIDDDYRFDYIEPAGTPLVPDTTQAVTAPADTASLAIPLPAYMLPEVQPELTGPVIRFTHMTMIFSTPFDSAFLRNTKGLYSLRDKIFVGEGGRFDWSSAGLGKDSVYYELTQFNFKTSTPVLKAGLGRMTYTGRLSSKIQGTFEFRSVNHKDQASASYPRFTSYNSNVSVIGLGSEKMRYRGGFGLYGAHMNSASVSGDLATLEVFGETDKKFKVRSRFLNFATPLLRPHRQRFLFTRATIRFIIQPLHLRMIMVRENLRW